MEKNPNVGWLGTGVMGASMAGHLLEAGYRLSPAYENSFQGRPLIDKGAKWATSPAEVAEQSDFVFTMLGYPHEVEEVYCQEKGCLRRLPAQFDSDRHDDLQSDSRGTNFREGRPKRVSSPGRSREWWRRPGPKTGLWRSCAAVTKKLSTRLSLCFGSWGTRSNCLVLPVPASASKWPIKFLSRPL